MNQEQKIIRNKVGLIKHQDEVSAKSGQLHRSKVPRIESPRSRRNRP